MSRKYRKTEISGKVNVEPNGQHVQSNWFCVNCHAIGSFETHYPDCTIHESYAIPATAEVPRKKASKQIWNTFKEQFVFVKPVGWWIDEINSWWYIHQSSLSSNSVDDKRKDL